MTGIRRGNKFLRNLKLIPTISNLNQGLVLQLNTPDIFFIIPKSPTPSPIIYDDHKGNNKADLEELAGFDGIDEEEEEMELKKITPQVACSYEYPSLTDFEEMYPPEGSKSIILYTTSLRGIRKTFQDCNTIRFLLRSFKRTFQERDVSLHMEYREELWKILGGKVIPPKLFIKGRYIGGAEEVVGLHEMGWLGKLLEGTPTESNDCGLCIGCANMRFVICSNCSGSRKVFTSCTSNSTNEDNSDDFFIKCLHCNENGLVKCPICCYKIN